MKRFFLYLSALPALLTQAQDVSFARKTVDTLTSANFWGRGYTKEGMWKAASYISEQFKQFGVQPMKGAGYLQAFTYPVNAFPGAMQLSVDGKALTPGTDFIVTPESRGVRGKGKLKTADGTTFTDRDLRFILQLKDTLTWSVAQEEADYTMVQVKHSAVGNKPERFTVDIENSFYKEFPAANVCGIVRGTEQPDSIIMITAHYDHLGGMGDQVYFPGANDNASGISLLLNLARYYAAHPRRWSIGFICFTGEEPGLLGSKLYTEHPVLPLNQIRFLLNTDLAGTGEEGITVVNATEFPREFALLNAINDEEKLLVRINPRGKAANSDHYFFTEKGVPAFFFYTMGGIRAYHDVFDKAATLPLTEHEDLFKLVVKFNDKLIGQ